MKVGSIQNNSSYTSQGSANVSAMQGTSQSTQTGDSAAQTGERVAVEATLENVNISTTGNEKGQASNEQIRQAVEKINKSTNNQEAVFGIHEATNRVTIKIVDKETKEVIREYPPEKTLDMIAKVWEMAGIMVDERR